MTGYKTLIFNALIAVWGVIETFDWTSVVGENAGIAMIIIGAVGAILRAKTSTPVGGK
jgi:hypothetical protein